MCGFTGYLTSHSTSSAVVRDNSYINVMTKALVHRGPNSEGHWSDPNTGVYLGHRRLSIVDLSPEGHQPKISPSQRYVIAFNGEIYNHLELRNELNQSQLGQTDWQGHSDTETLIACIDAWGLEITLKKALGMFAFALWDCKDKRLFLARDRLGEKPVYYGWQGGVFLFGSELKALKQHPNFKAEINRDAITLYLRHNYIPTPYSIYHNIFKLEPGCFLSVSENQPEPIKHTYWSACAVAEEGVRNPFIGGKEKAVDELDRLLRNSVREQMVADVPLGAFLSGGIDSSTIVASMQAESSRPIKTFTIGFHEEGYNEAKHAAAIAKHLGTEHTELYITPEEAMSVIPKLPSLYCEPFSDSSQIPTFLVAQLAKQHVTVSLSGDAGDELFCGYNRYQLTDKLWNKINLLPIPLREGISKGITSISPQAWNNITKYIPGMHKYNNVGDKLYKGAGVLGCKTVDELYVGLVSNVSTPEELVIYGAEPPTLLTGNAPVLSGLDEVQRMMALDLITYLPDDILVKVDRAAMGVSLETRVPFLNHKIVEFAWKVPQSMKLVNGQSKWILRQVLYKYVPKKLIERPKMGFGVPIDIWLRGPLRDWAETLLDESRLHREGYFNPLLIRKKWEEHLSGRRNWQQFLWNILMFQAWLDEQ